MKSAIRNICCLTIITLAAGFGLGYVYELTKEPIIRMEEKQRQDAYKSVFAEASSFSDDMDIGSAPSVIASSGIEGVEIDSCVEAVDASGSVLGYVINSTSHNGYGGDITVSIGIDNNGVVKGVEMLSISETAGLGMKAKESRFKDQFSDKAVKQFTYTKTGAASDFEIDAISGATITTKAVTDAVNAALAYYESIGGGI